MPVVPEATKCTGELTVMPLAGAEICIDCPLPSPVRATITANNVPSCLKLAPGCS